jgi:hypothetical protein
MLGAVEGRKRTVEYCLADKRESVYTSSIMSYKSTKQTQKWRELFLTLVTTEPNWGSLGVMEDAERTNDRQTHRKLGPGVMGT